MDRPDAFPDCIIQPVRGFFDMGGGDDLLVDEPRQLNIPRDIPPRAKARLSNILPLLGHPSDR